MKRPNFIVFMTDQQPADHLGCYGNPDVRTPHIDQLADRGTRFTRFYTNTPICQPNRCSLFTGLMPSVTGVRQNGIPLGLDTLTVADVLAEQGYQTGYIGKAHFQNVTPIPAPERRLAGQGDAPGEDCRNSLTAQRSGPDYDNEIRASWAQNPDRDMTLPYYGFQHVRLCIGHGDQVEGHYTGWLRAQHSDPDQLRGPAQALPDPGIPAPQCWRTAVPESLYPTTYVKQEAIRYLETATTDKPFILVVSFPDPHHPFTPPGRYWSMYDPESLKLPDSFDHDVDGIEGLTESELVAYRWGDANRNSHYPFHVSAQEARKILALNYGMISMVDDAIGEIMQTVQTSNHADNTVILYTSDHGDYMGDHGTMLKMGLHYQSVIRVPFIWCEPGKQGKSGISDHQLASAIDLTPTLLQRANIAIPVGIQGRDLWARGPQHAQPPVVIEDPGIEVFDDSDADNCITTLVTTEWRLSVFSHSPNGELYDLRHDPQENQNLWYHPDYQQVRCELHALLLQRILALKDRRLVATARA